MSCQSGCSACIQGMLLAGDAYGIRADFSVLSAQQVLRTNLYTSFNIVHASIKAMLAEQHGGPTGGAVALVSAAVASHGIPNFSAMSAAKAGVEGG